MAGTRGGRRKGLIAAGGVLALLLAAGAGAGGYRLLSDDDNGSQATTSVAGVNGLKPGVPRIVSPAQLKDLAAEQSPIYWAGEIPDTQIEVTVTTDGATYVRYLPQGQKAGTKNEYLTVGTYAAIDGYHALLSAKKKDADVALTQSKAVIATFHSAPDSTYFAFPDSSFQVEVFSPKQGEARKLTENGTIGLVRAGA